MTEVTPPIRETFPENPVDAIHEIVAREREIRGKKASVLRELGERAQVLTQNKINVKYPHLRLSIRRGGTVRGDGIDVTENEVTVVYTIDEGMETIGEAPKNLSGKIHGAFFPFFEEDGIQAFIQWSNRCIVARVTLNSLREIPDTMAGELAQVRERIGKLSIGDSIS